MLVGRTARAPHDHASRHPIAQDHAPGVTAACPVYDESATGKAAQDDWSSRR